MLAEVITGIEALDADEKSDEFAAQLMNFRKDLFAELSSQFSTAPISVLAQAIDPSSGLLRHGGSARLSRATQGSVAG
jgi:hypothetical protein